MLRFSASALRRAGEISHRLEDPSIAKPGVAAIDGFS